MKNENFKFKVWVLLFNRLTLIAPINLLDEDTLDASKWVTLAIIKKAKVEEEAYEYDIFGNPEYMDKINGGKNLIGEKPTIEECMIEVETVIEEAYPPDEDEEVLPTITLDNNTIPETEIVVGNFGIDDMYPDTELEHYAFQLEDDAGGNFIINGLNELQTVGNLTPDVYDITVSAQATVDQENIGELLTAEFAITITEAEE